VLKTAIIGCGKIADSHAAQISRIAGCEIVGVCDRERLMARQLYERFSVNQYYASVGELLNESRPDVVHITTPPATHFDLARICLEAGCHIYVEKPFTLYEHEAQTLVRMAEARGLKITAGHDDQFSHVARRMRALVQSGYLGNGPIHMESFYGYELGRTGYAGAVLGDRQHWVRKLPGGLLHNIISHGIARIAEFLTSESPQVIVHGFTSSFLRSLGEREIVDELRLIIGEEDGTTAYFTFSSQIRPSLHQFRIYGAANGLVLDQDHETLIRLRGAHYKSYLEKFVPPVTMASQQIGNVLTNLRMFLGRDFHMKSGMKHLIESFYRSITEGAPVPIPYREIVLTARIMDAIFAQLDARVQLGERMPSARGR
jgi:predicted dehydrogenase